MTHEHNDRDREAKDQPRWGPRPRIILTLVLASLLFVSGATALPSPTYDGATPPVVGELEPALLRLDGYEDHTTEFEPSGSDLAGAAGIGPGSQLLIHIDGTVRVCTANYVWEDADGEMYLGAAGHCFLPDGAHGEHGGNSSLVENVRTRVCVSGCVFASGVWAATFGLGPALVGETVSLGNVAYAKAEGVGLDFGLVEIPAEHADLVRYRMPVWEGPSSTDDVEPGDLACYYGYGVGFGDASKARDGAFVRYDPLHQESWEAIAPVSSGDSGGAIARCEVGPDGLVGVDAVGVITHLSVGLAGVYPKTAAGTTMPQAQSMAAGLGLEVAPVLAS